MKELPQIGDTVHIRADVQRKHAGSMGIVRKVRTRRDGYWTAAEVAIGDEHFWFTKGEIDRIVKRRANLGAPKGDFIRIERRPNKRKTDVALHIYVGRALLARWREVAGDIKRVVLQVVDGKLTLRADPYGAYALDATPGRMPRIHCDSARSFVTLEDGRYTTRMDGATVIVMEPLAADVGPRPRTKRHAEAVPS